MGLSIAVSGVIVFVALMYVLFNIPGMMNFVFSVEETSSMVSELEESISQTNISMDNLAAVSGSPRVNFTLNNDGDEKLWNFEKFNLIITYDGSNRLTENLSYSGDCSGSVPSVGNWCIQAISADLLDPDILNNGESASIRTQVSQNLVSGIVIVVTSTDNGVVATLSTTT